MNKKEVSINKVVKSNIIGFASYGVIFYVLTILILVLASTLVGNRIDLNSNGVVLSVVFSIFVFILIRFICRISTMDTFKRCVVNKDSHGRICKKLSMFYLICIVLCIFTGLAMLSANLKLERSKIMYYSVIYSKDNFFSKEHIDLLEKEALQEYEANKKIMVISTIITELGLTFGFLSLINYQGKMLNRYNDYKEDNSNENENTAEKTQEVQNNTTEEKNEENNVNDDAEIDKMAEEIKNLS